MSLWTRTVGSVWHRRVGARLAPVAAALAFVGAWGLGVAEWGVLLGGGFGWLPAAFVAAFAGAAVYCFWLPLLAAGAVSAAALMLRAAF